MKIKKIRWIDSHALSNWCDPEEYREVAKSRQEITTIGFVIEETPEYYVLVQSYGNDQVDNGIMIYKSSINTEKDL